MLSQRIKVTYDDGREVTATVGPLEFVKFERHFSTPSKPVGMGDFQTHQKYEWILYLAFLGVQKLHKAGEHDGPVKPDFDGFLSVVADFDLLDSDPLEQTTP